jgi:heptosyltransferase III
MNPVLLFRPGGLGDVLAALPSLRFLRLCCGSAPFLLAARGDAAALLKAAGIVDEIYSLDDRRLAPLFSPAAGRPFSLELNGLRPVALWSWFFNPPSPAFEAAASSLFPGAAHIIAYNPSAGRSVSLDWFERTTEAAARKVSAAEFEHLSRLPQPGSRAPARSAAGLAVVHPGSGGTKKRWPLERFMAVISALAEDGLAGWLVTGPAEDEADSAFRPVLPAGWRRLASPLLSELVGRLEACSLYIGNDSGVTHLAAAAGAPVLALFRDEYLPAWRPFGRTTVLHAARPELITVEDVLFAARGIIERKK